jgi:DNA-binding NarL/FixJ family response regulator
MTKILMVDNYEEWRRKIRELVQVRPDLQIISEASDGLEGVQRAAELQPDLILLDLGLPELHGIEAARQIRTLSPNTKIIFVSQENLPDVVQEALSTGALAYVYKARAGSELLRAIDSVLRGERFISSSKNATESTKIKGEYAPHRHEVQFYSDDAVFVDSCARFIASTLKAGNAAIVAVTKSHHDDLVQRLKEESVDIEGAIQQGTYTSLDAADSLSNSMVNGLPDPVRFFEDLRSLIGTASKAANAEHPRVIICGECVSLLWVEGKTDAAIRLEQLCNQLTATHDVDIFCGFPLSCLHGEEGAQGYRTICAEHSAVYHR